MSEPKPVRNSKVGMVEDRTSRGFRFNEFTDLYGVKCDIQKSSLATQDAIWLGVAEDSVKHFIPGEGWVKVELPDEVLIDRRMHLSKEHAREIIKVLQKFVRTGNI